MKEKLTPWFPQPVTPFRGGVYQVLINGGVKYARWEQGQWHLALHDYGRAKTATIRSLNCYDKTFGGWRGLAKRPPHA